MAVSFKVPASPKKSIFVIDEFKGVDLTNTGANVDETRSPNAPNMIRYVPGKVRKRMGFEKEMLFGRDINVNRALNTSLTEREIIIKDEDAGQSIKIYDLLMPFVSKDGGAYSMYYEFDYVCSDDFVINGDVDVTASEEYVHFSYVRPCNSTEEFNDISIVSDVGQRIYIKNFAVMYGKDSNYKWSPAPKYFIERETNDPIYGMHNLKTGNFDGNRVVNVNRALQTSADFVTKSASTTAQLLYDLGEPLYMGRKIIVDFDYQLTGSNVEIYFYSSINSSYTATLDTLSATSTTLHKTYEITPSQIYAFDGFKIRTSSSTGSLKIRNFTALYQKDEATYDWSKAPEDEGMVFPVQDIYYVGAKNYAISEEYDASVQTTEAGGVQRGIITLLLSDAVSNVKGFAHVEFDVHTSFSTTMTGCYFRIRNSNNDTLYQANGSQNNVHYDLYMSTNGSDKYVKDFYFIFTLSTQGVGYVSLRNVKINTIKPRSNYDISSWNYLYHVGSDIYYRPSNSDIFTKIYTQANRHLSSSWQFDKKLYILDGKNIYQYANGEDTLTPIGLDNGTIPTVTIAKGSEGGGVPLEPLNMLQPGFIELFQSKEDTVRFQLSFGNLDDTIVKAWILDEQGTWGDVKIEGTHFSVNRASGLVTFRTSPGVSPIEGEDNVKILAYKTITGYRERVTKCTIGTLFGVGGAQDRLFISGNPDYPNWDFYSEIYDPTYFPDTGYSTLGSEISPIVGYALVNNYLAAFNDGTDGKQTVFIREGDFVVNENTGMGEPSFKLINTLQGNGVVAPYAFGALQTEPLFLTKSGIEAITSQDITGEKYSQNRSFYLNGLLTKEPNLDEAVATVFHDMYILAVNNKLYILDGLQPVRTDRSEPYATRQYVAFYCTDVPAVSMWSDDDLWFGTADGRICKFNSDVDSLDSYNDDGQPIYCCWETPDLDGKLFYKNKTFRYFAIRMMKALRTSVLMSYQKLGTWTDVKEDTSSGVVFDFENINFELFSFSTDTSEKVAHTKVRVKKVDKARFRVENQKVNEPFGLFDLALEYIESGNYKG